MPDPSVRGAEFALRRWDPLELAFTAGLESDFGVTKGTGIEPYDLRDHADHVVSGRDSSLSAIPYGGTDR